MSNNFDDLIESGFKATEKEFRESVFSKGNSVLVPIWLISDISKYNLDDEDFLGNQSPYIDKGFEIPEKIIPTIIDKPLYHHKQTNRHFFLKNELSAELLSMFEEHCESTSVSDVATHYPENKQYDWTDANKVINRLSNKYEFLSPDEIQSNMELITSSIDQVGVSPAALDYLEVFAKSNWTEKYNTNLASLMLGISFAKSIPGFTNDNLQELVCMLVFKDIGYSRLVKEIKEYELLHGLISYKLMSDSNAKIKEGPKLSDLVLESILKQHEFTDGSGALASRQHPLVINDENGVSVPIYAQISGICELFHHFYQREETVSIAYAMLKGMCFPIGNVKGKYDITILQQFESFYQSSLLSKDEGNKSHLEKKLQSIMQDVALEWRFDTTPGALAELEKINKSIYEQKKLDVTGQIAKLFCILRLLSNTKTNITNILTRLCPYPPEFAQD